MAEKLPISTRERIATKAKIDKEETDIIISIAFSEDADKFDREIAAKYMWEIYESKITAMKMEAERYKRIYLRFADENYQEKRQEDILTQLGKMGLTQEQIVQHLKTLALKAGV